MNAIEHDLFTDDIHPIDIVETLAAHHDWDFDRVAEDQIAMSIEGSWRSYSLSLAWSGHEEVLRLICTFEMEPPEDRIPELLALMDKANDRLWTGAFTLWSEQKMMIYRYGLTLCGEQTASASQIDYMVQAAVMSCERFYPAFQLVCWGNRSAQEALGIAIAEAYGRA
ncbi:diacylglyceryl transferase [Paroceanicella profunda]|uniref:Diacylglyceryl transferase n=1 Tax=Paroceanicella profunda TaxID=2579971 RepID=A0A5B8FYX0_9RHOB|nr:YbjN domain-containing protein [Paroceanicella profunda]QDL91403.1 diacylglyceryl transferase [Paroceanicella profunda]